MGKPEQPSKIITEIEIALQSLADPEGERFIGDVGRTLLQQCPELEPDNSLAFVVRGRAERSEWINLHHGCTYMVGGYAIMADAHTVNMARDHGFHWPSMGVRVVERTALCGLSTEKILTLPKLGPNWVHKQGLFGFREATCLEKGSLPTGIRGLHQSVYFLTPRGLEIHLRSASTAWKPGKFQFGEHLVHLTNNTFLEVAGMRAALANELLAVGGGGRGRVGAQQKPRLTLVKPAS